MLVQRHLVVTVALLVAAVIHLLPVVGVLGSTRLEALYGLPVTDPNLAILMRHRAVLFGLLGAFLAIAAFRPALQGSAFVAGFVSVLSFLGLAWSTGGYNALVGRVVIADIVALLGLLIGLVAFLSKRS